LVLVLAFVYFFGTIAAFQIMDDTLNVAVEITARYTLLLLQAGAIAAFLVCVVDSFKRRDRDEETAKLLRVIAAGFAGIFAIISIPWGFTGFCVAALVIGIASGLIGLAYGSARLRPQQQY
jgi:hypothetical protein